ncbi:hypothetical protein Tco_1445370, partial [Tanacetum coccineum]
IQRKFTKKRDRDDKDPLAGPNQGKKTNRSRTKESEPSKKSSTTKESSKGKSPAKTSKFGKSVTVEQPVKELIFEMASDDIEQTIDDVVIDIDQPPDDTTQTKDKASNTWMAFGGNTHNLGSFGEETDNITTLHQESRRIVHTERGDGVATIKRQRQDLNGDGV